MIKAVDREHWITCKGAVPLKACTAMAGRNCVVNVLGEVFDLLFEKPIQLGKHQWVINRIMEDHGKDNEIEGDGSDLLNGGVNKNNFMC